MASTLKVGDSFSTWEEFQAALTEFQRSSNVLLSKISSKTVETENKRLSDNVQKYPSAHVYASVQFGCIHFGKARSRVTGVRPNQSSFRMECPAHIKVRSDRKSGRLVIRAFNNDHNHAVTEEIKKMYPSQRRLDGSRLEEARKLASLRSSVHQDETELEALQRVLQGFLATDEGGKLALVVGENRTLEGIYLQTSMMVSAFSKYPKTLFLDCTYGTNDLNMTLFTLSVVDGGGFGQPVLHVLSSGEVKPALVKALQMFKHHNPAHSSVVTIVVDGDVSEAAVVAEEFPDAKVVICLSHTLRALTLACNQYVKYQDLQEKVISLVKKLAFSSTEKCFFDANEELLMLPGAEEFVRYFQQNWLNRCFQWAKPWVDQHTNFNWINNCFESNQEKLKNLLQRQTTLSQLLEKLLRSPVTVATQASVRAFNQQMKAPVRRVHLSQVHPSQVHPSQVHPSQVACQEPKSPARKVEPQRQEQNGSTCQTLPPRQPMSSKAKYRETLNVCREIAAVNSLCDDEEYNRRLVQLRYLLNCFKANKPVAFISTEDNDSSQVGRERNHVSSVVATEVTVDTDHSATPVQTEAMRTEIMGLTAEETHAVPVEAKENMTCVEEGTEKHGASERKRKVEEELETTEERHSSKKAAGMAQNAPEADSPVYPVREIKKEQVDQEEMQCYAQDTMNELLGMFGYDGVDETETGNLRVSSRFVSPPALTPGPTQEDISVPLWCCTWCKKNTSAQNVIYELPDQKKTQVYCCAECLTRGKAAKCKKTVPGDKAITSNPGPAQD